MSKLRNIIIDAILTDDSYTQKQEILILNYYKNAKQDEKQLIDNLFIALCGYSLNSIILKSRTKDLKSQKNKNEINNIEINY